MDAIHEERVRRVLGHFVENGLTQAIIVDPLTIFYLTGYYVEPHERLFALLIDIRNTPQAALVVNRLFPAPDVEGVRVLTYDDTDDAAALLADFVDPSRWLGVDGNLPARWTLPVVERHGASDLWLTDGIVDFVRSVKDECERELMRRASAINDQAMSWLREQVAPGVTEREVAERLLRRYQDLGAQDFSFAPIVSFAAHTADPHHEPDDTALVAGDMVLFDVGCTLERYCSDMTRTFFTASPSALECKVYDTVLRANEAAEAVVAPGVTFAEIDRTARRIIEEAGYGPYFTHRLGHQIGLAVHEPGDVSAAHTERVREGEVFSIEPGIYLPQGIGVRIEDLVCVTEGGCEVLNHYPKDLQVIEMA